MKHPLTHLAGFQGLGHAGGHAGEGCAVQPPQHQRRAAELHLHKRTPNTITNMIRHFGGTCGNWCQPHAQDRRSQASLAARATAGHCLEERTAHLYVRRLLQPWLTVHLQKSTAELPRDLQLPREFHA